MPLQYIFIPAVTLATAVSGSYFTSAGMGWYKDLKKPAWTPPGMVIGLVWTMLYVLATISAIIFWQEAAAGNGFILTAAFFLINAFLNVFWSYLFFSRHEIEGATYEAGALAFTVLILIVFLLPVSTLAWLLLVPYFLWTSFATYLTYNVWLLNKHHGKS